MRFLEKSDVDSLCTCSKTALKSSSATFKSASSRALRYKTSAESMTEYSTPAALAMSLANFISLCACFKGKLGLWSFTTILGPFKLNMGDWMAPCPMTSIILLGSNPTDSDKAKPSPNAANMVPMSELTTNLARVPAPTSVPKKWLAFPMTFNPLSLISLNKSSDPAHKKINDPMAAGPLEPETGASKNRPPLSMTALFIPCISTSAKVAQSTMDLPSDTPAKTPASPSKTILLTSGVDNML
mmetsp:Transcript_2067/g.4342  ORF Transcript_2067/g.4342 Transcript_2067/m.4342 type:complete len:242 (+) Transcript_2067:165-890(+)